MDFLFDSLKTPISMTLSVFACVGFDDVAEIPTTRVCVDASGPFTVGEGVADELI